MNKENLAFEHEYRCPDLLTKKRISNKIWMMNNSEKKEKHLKCEE